MSEGQGTGGSLRTVVICDVVADELLRVSGAARRDVLAGHLTEPGLGSYTCNWAVFS